jgi:hypothetical protein
MSSVFPLDVRWWCEPLGLILPSWEVAARDGHVMPASFRAAVDSMILLSWEVAARDGNPGWSTRLKYAFFESIASRFQDVGEA